MKLYTKFMIVLSILMILLSLICYSSEDKDNITEIEVYEGDLVNLKVTATDEDIDDTLYYTFELPLNSTGQWQTTYGDYGEWETYVTVSDGKLNTVKPVKIKVYKSNWPPVLEDIEDTIVNEGDIFTINPYASDEEDDEIDYTISEPVGDDGEWETGYEDAGEYVIEVTATDNNHDPVSTEFTLIVKDVNRDPIISEYVPEEENIEIYEDSEKIFAISACDPDKDELEFIWEIDNEKVSTESKFIYHPDYESSGNHVLKGSVSDGSVILSVSWNIKVIDVNRPPVLDPIDDIIIDETGSVKLDFSAKDPDGDDIRYSISDPIGDDKEWQTGYEDSGEYDIKVVISDGEYFASQNFSLTVNDVDRAPEFENIEDITITELETAEIRLEAVDPDGDEIIFRAENLPDKAIFKDDKFTFETSYETVYKTKNWITSVLKFLHIDNIIYGNKRVFPIRFTAAGKEKTSSQIVNVIVEDLNRAPVLIDMEDIVIKEGENVDVLPKAVEYDNDRVKFTISQPLNKDGEWQTGYEDAGSYIVEVSASDGRSNDSTSFTIDVEDVNRAPVLKDIKDISIEEGQEINLDVTASDPDEDNIEISAENMPEGAIFSEGKLTWTPGHEVAGYDEGIVYYGITFTASDGELSDSKEVVICVNDKNQPPEFIDLVPKNNTITVLKGKSVIFKANATDHDMNDISYRWKFGMFDKLKDSTYGVKRTFWKLGTKTVEVTVSDGMDEITNVWTVNVIENPALELEKQKVIEAEAKKQQQAEEDAKAAAIAEKQKVEKEKIEKTSETAVTTGPKKYSLTVV